MTVLLLSAGRSMAQVPSKELSSLSEKIEAQNVEIQNLKKQLSSETSGLKEKFDNYAPIGLVVFLCGSICALWAQGSGRNAWIWFFFGLFFNVLAMITLLSKNSIDRRLDQ